MYPRTETYAVRCVSATVYYVSVSFPFAESSNFVLCKILRALLGEQLVSDESLRTMMTEVQSILNSRPLTPVSSDPKDLEPITPNHLLLLRSNANFPSGIFSKEDMYTRRRWRQVQYLSNVFWKHWLKEYLPTLQERKKWLKPRRCLSVGDLVLIVDD